VTDPSAAVPHTSMNPAVLDGLRAFGGDALLGQLVSLYRDQVTLRGQALADAVASGDAAALKQAAHALKGSAAQVGATGIHDLCGLLEQAAATGDLSHSAELLAQLRAALPVVDGQLADRGFPR
jgi:two-component system, sensor histidine kinase and response regulator